VSGIWHEFLTVSNSYFARFIGMYLVAIFVWGLLLVKFVILGKKTFGKTRLDVYLMGILTLFLISTLFAQDRVRGVFGTFGTSSYSVITLLSVTILYYVIVLLFRYLRGVKWLSFAFLLSILVSGVYFISQIARNAEVGSQDYLSYAVLSIPLSIGTLFIFRKKSLKVLSLIALLINLYLVAYYSRFLTGSMFVLSVGVLALFLLFYFSFWIKNSVLIGNFVNELLKRVKNIKDLGNFVSKRKKESFTILMIALMALWILGFAYFSFSYYKSDIGPYLGDWIREDVGKMDGIRMWLIGENNLSSEFSSMEVFNILGNYGILTVLLFISFFSYCAYLAGKRVLALLYNGSFKNIILR
jgi:hypothetical protein